MKINRGLLVVETQNLRSSPSTVNRCHWNVNPKPVSGNSRKNQERLLGLKWAIPGTNLCKMKSLAIARWPSDPRGCHQRRGRGPPPNQTEAIQTHQRSPTATSGKTIRFSPSEGTAVLWYTRAEPSRSGWLYLCFINICTYIYIYALKDWWEGERRRDAVFN